MGATNFIEVAEGYSAKECFGILVDAALEEFGHDCYNGTISTCSMSGRPRVLAKEYSADVEEKAKKIIEDEDYGEKWIAKCLDLGVVRYEVSTFKKVTPKSAKPPKYKMQFIVREATLKKNGPVIKPFPHKKDADSFAFELAKKGQDVEVIKGYALVEGNDVVSEFKQETKEYAKDPHLKPMPNRVIKEVHKYWFYGWAGC